MALYGPTPNIENNDLWQVHLNNVQVYYDVKRQVVDIEIEEVLYKECAVSFLSV